MLSNAEILFKYFRVETMQRYPSSGEIQVSTSVATKMFVRCKAILYRMSKSLRNSNDSSSIPQLAQNSSVNLSSHSLTNFLWRVLFLGFKCVVVCFHTRACLFLPDQESCYIVSTQNICCLFLYLMAIAYNVPFYPYIDSRDNHSHRNQI